jgi:hypothetical protein
MPVWPATFLFGVSFLASAIITWFSPEPFYLDATPYTGILLYRWMFETFGRVLSGTIWAAVSLLVFYGAYSDFRNNERKDEATMDWEISKAVIPVALLLWLAIEALL